MNLRRRILRGLAWKVASQAVLQGSRIVVAVVLARLLTPEEYGIAGMVLVVASLVLVFSDLALGAALVQRPTLTERDRSTVFWTGLVAGVIFTLLGLGLAGPAAAFYGEPQVQPLLAVLSLSFVLTSLGTTQSALLLRELQFGSLELRMMAGTLAGAGVGIAVAARGHGPWAIVAQQLATATVSTGLLWLVSPWRPRLAFSMASLRSLAGFGGNVFGQRLLYYLHANADKVLIGRVLGAPALGVYSLASSVVLVPFSRLAVPVAEVLFPAFARMQEDRERLAAAWLRAVRLVGAVAVPALAGLVVVAPDFVLVVLGPRWLDAVPVIQVVAWVGVLQSLQTLNAPILQALDRTGTLLRYSLVFFAAHLAAFVGGLPFGVVGVAAAYALSSTLVEPFYAWLTARALGVPLRELARALAGPAQAGLGLAVAAWATRAALLEAGVPAGLRLLVVVLVGAAAAVGLAAWRVPELRVELRRLRPQGA